jgi:DNA mismatch repair protein MutS2
MKRLLETPRIAKQLQDHYFTEWEDRCVLPVRADAGSVIDGLVLGCSASGATVFVEPAAVMGLSNELKVQQVAVARETARLLAELSALVRSEHPGIAADLELATELDLIVARARLAQRLDAQPAAVAEDAQLVLRGLRHPLLVLAGGEVVAHDVALLPQQALLISGPNAGGKSVCLKSVGLCALMLRCGMHLPVASESRLPCYHHVWANIGDEQSIERNLSTFTGHLGRLLGYLERADRGTLLLLDEITTGTDPGEGAALGQALLEALVERVGQLVVTTHYDTLKTLPLGDRRFVNASVGFDLQRLEPTFELHRGVPGSSFALAVARRLGLPAALSTRAQHLLGEQATLTTELLVTLTDERTRLRQAQQQHAAAELRAVAERQGYERQRAELRQRDQQALTQAHREALTELQRARGELKQLRAALRRSAGPEPASGESLRTLDRQLSVLARTIGAHEPRPAPPPGPKLRAEALVVGAQVQLAELGAPAEIVELPQRGRVTVLLGGLRTKVRLDQLHALAPPAGHGAGPAAAAPRSRSEPGAARAAAALDTPGRGPDNTLDVRGLRVEEALRATDRFVDRSLLEGRDLVYVLHGHGSGALRAAVRAALERSPSVERCRAAAPDQGGEALTMVWLG